MGDNNIVTKTTGEASDASDLNQYHAALSGDLIPRSIEGIPADLAGSSGTEDLSWLKAHIANGYWSAGDIKAHHSYNGTTPIDNGWFPCDGTVINETSYDAIHGTGAWAQFVGTSIFDGKYSPDLLTKYLTGAATTTEDGTAPMSTVGNASNQVNISHTHTITDHNHQWYHSTGGGGVAPTGLSSGSLSGKYDQTYNSSGTAINLPDSGGTFGTINADCYTDDETDTTNAGGSTTQTIRPESIEITYYLRII